MCIRDRSERNPFGQWWVLARAAPLNQLARRLHDGRDKVARVVIVSNVDTALLVMGLDHDFNTRRLERYLALVRMAGVAAVVVLTKKDLCADAAQRLQQVQSMLPPDTLAVAGDALGAEPVSYTHLSRRLGKCVSVSSRARRVSASSNLRSRTRSQTPVQ